MSSFICICNPVRVWDYAGFFATKREIGYWVFPKSTFREVSENDSLYLRVTQADKLPGVYAKFSVTGKRTGVCPKEFWRPGAYPQDLQYLVDFEVREYFPTQRVTPDDMRMAGVSASSPLLRVPQAKAAIIESHDATILENLIARRRQNNI
jgi:hypothetical protein